MSTPSSNSICPEKTSGNFRIVPSNWSRLFRVRILLLFAPLLPIRFVKFVDEPGLNTGVILFLWLAFFCFWFSSSYRAFRTAFLVSIEEGEMRFQNEVSGRVGPPELVVALTDDLIDFHLFSKKNEISLSKKTVPDELARFLDERIAEEARAKP
jgi:hypothetical protein